ncbi:uncharacterized protein C1orf94 homolog [Ctenodactylus gundi]
MKGGRGRSLCLEELSRQKGFWKKRRMASGNGLASSSALVAKRPSALGPFPRYVWIHQDTPQDSLDKACHEIWKRVQGLQPSVEHLPAPTAGSLRDHGLSSFQEEALELSRGTDEISLLVEQEFLSLTKEHLFLVQESSDDPEAPDSVPQGTSLGSEHPGASLLVGNKLQEQKRAVSVIGSRKDCSSAVSTVAGILHASKVKNASDPEGGDHSLGDSNSEISKLLAQFPLKSMEMSKAPDNKMVLEETFVLKDFLQNNLFGGSGAREMAGLGPFLLLPWPPPPTPLDKLSELPAQKRQLPVFAKICSKSEADPAAERQRSMEQNPGTKDLTKSRESLFLSQWTHSRKDFCGDEGHSDPGGTLPTKKPALLAEKNLPYEFLGTSKIPSGQLRLRSKVEVDGLELKFSPSVTAADKNNLKYTGNVFTPRFATALTSTTMNQPFWLNLNCPPPPMFPNHSTFPQYQGMYPQRSSRMPYQQAVHPQLGCYSRQVTPYNLQQMGQQLGQQVFRSSYTPLLSYIPFVQPNYQYPQRTPQKMSSNPRDPSPMAGDGPQYLFPQGYGFSSSSGGPLVNNPYFSSSGNGINF